MQWSALDLLLHTFILSSFWYKLTLDSSVQAIQSQNFFNCFLQNLIRPLCSWMLPVVVPCLLSWRLLLIVDFDQVNDTPIFTRVFLPLWFFITSESNRSTGCLLWSSRIFDTVEPASGCSFFSRMYQINLPTLNVFATPLICLLGLTTELPNASSTP